MGRDRNDSGRYNDRIEPDTVLSVFEQRDDRAEPLTASDVVDEMGIARRTAHNKLNELTERGALATKKVGARGRVWWTPIKAGPSEDIVTSGSSVEPTPRSDPTPTTPTQEERTGRESAQETEDSQDHVTTLDVPGSGATADARRETIGKMYEYLKEHGTGQKSEFIELVDADAVGYESAESFWSNVIKASGYDGLEDLPGVVAPGTGEHKYRFEGDT